MGNESGLAMRSSGQLRPWQIIAITLVACATTTLLATPLLGYLDLANIVMLFLLTVLLVAVTLGRGAAVLAAVLNVLLFDIFFVPPRFSLAVSNIQYVVTFAVMLATGLIAGQLAAGLKLKAQEARQREQETRALYEVARQLAGTLALAQVVEAAQQFVRDQIGAEAAVLVPDEAGHLKPAAGGRTSCRSEPHLAQVAQSSGELVRTGEIAGSDYASLYLPLKASLRVRGVLALAVPDGALELPEDKVALAEALASLVAVAVERLHYVEVAQATQLGMASERLRSSILSALSHDLRTPLTALVGLADSLFLVKPPLPGPALENAQAIREQAERLAGLVGNLLDMARLNAGNVTLRREWQPLEEVVGASIKLLGGALDGHPVHVAIPADLPLLEFDAVLIERVFCNLLENAAKYSPAGSPIEIGAARAGEVVDIRVCDRGKGFPDAGAQGLFDMFVRGRNEVAGSGTGLGLAICRAIVEAHGGEIGVDNRPECGACVHFTLPAGVPPVVEEEPA
ncbi:MAG: DUF4118 domain-containing protein [Azonexus sp.]|nr:DUF4118 domain-containing protein [Azonexus sp.]